MKTLLTLTLLAFLPAAISQADVNMKDASFYKTWIDLEIFHENRLFQLRRTYSSRSLHPGLFGYGWCSDFEKTLDLSRSDQILLKDCRLPAPIKFKKKKPNLYESPSKETLELKNNRYLRTTLHKSHQNFDRQGKLLNLIDKNQDRVDLGYDAGGFIQSVAFNGQEILKIEADSLRRHIDLVNAKSFGKISYSYKGRDLIQVQNAWKNTFNYSYDDFHNLVRIRYPDQNQEVLTYDTENDWILSITTRDLCQEHFQFRQQGPLNGYIATAERRCQGKLLKKISYEFRHKARADGTTYLDQVKITQGNGIQRVSFKNHLGPLNENQ